MLDWSPHLASERKKYLVSICKQHLLLMVNQDGTRHETAADLCFAVPEPFGSACQEHQRSFDARARSANEV